MRAVAVLTVSVLLAGCGSAPRPTPLPTSVPTPRPTTAAPSADAIIIHVTNGTPLTLSIVVNGHAVGESRGSGAPFALSTATLGSPPWNVEAHGGSTGRVLVSLVVDSADDQPGRGRGQYVDLSCGRIWIWVGITPDAPVGPLSDKPGDCP